MDGVQLYGPAGTSRTSGPSAPRVSHQRLPALMGQAGWTGPKRIKATSPTQRDALVWGFYIVPAGWDSTADQLTGDGR